MELERVIQLAAVASCFVAPMGGIMFVAYKYVFKPLDDEIEFYGNMAETLREINDRRDFAREQEIIKQESVGAREINPRKNGERTKLLPPR